MSDSMKLASQAGGGPGRQMSASATGANVAAAAAAEAAEAKPMRKPVMRLLYCPPMPLLWSAEAHDGRPSSRIHKIYLHGLWRKPWHLRLGIALSFLAWPFIVLASAAVATTLNGRQASRRSGRPITSLFFEQIRFAARYGILPPWYFVYELEDPARHVLASSYINRYEAKGGLYKLLRYHAGSRDDKTLNDKAACARACRAAGLPTPEVIVELRDGKAEWIAAERRFPEADLFVKSIQGQGGDGAERWLLEAPGRWRNGAGLVLDGERLLNHLRKQSKRMALLVQPRMRNHAALDDLNCGALATVRVLSIWDEQGQPEVTNAAFKMPARPGAIVDNFCAGGVATAVDVKTGRLGHATNFGLLETMHWRDDNPATGAQIEGRELPLWPEVIDFARRLHALFITFPVIGFDIAITPDGPCLIEANGSSALDLIQRTARGPVGDTRFGALLAFHLERAEAWRRRSMGEPAEAPERAKGGKRRLRLTIPTRWRPRKLGPRILMSVLARRWSRLPADRSPALRIHRMFCERLVSNDRSTPWLVRAVYRLVWFPLVVCLAVACAAIFGSKARRRSGKRRRRQVVEQIGLALRHAIPPYCYYEVELWHDDRRTRALDYLYRFELKGKANGVYALLHQHASSPESGEALSSKSAFARLCEAGGAAVVPVLAVVEDGKLRAQKPGADPLPPTGLFVKPLRGSGGKGASAWTWRGDGTWRSSSGQELTRSGLIAYLQALSAKQAYVVRELAYNHRDLRPLSAGALSTARVITCLDENDRPEVTNALFKMAVDPDAVVDNYHAGGIVAKVDIATGALDAATAGGRRWRSHPTSNAPIAGFTLPMWDQVLALALKAHSLFPDRFTVGWDIAILDDGPMLVEGNKGPGLDSIQITLGEPVGSARFGELLAFHLERALDPAYHRAGSSKPESKDDR